MKKKRTVACARLTLAALLALCLTLSGCGAPRTGAQEPGAAGAASSAAAASNAAEASGAAEKASAPDEASSAAEEASAPAEVSCPDESGPEVESGSVLLFASDYQHRDGWEDPPVTLDKVLDAVYAAGVRPDNYVFCGDYTGIDGKNNYNADPHKAIREIKGICLDHDRSLKPEEMIFVQGNHDQLTADLSAAGLHDYGDYLVYVLNTQTEYPWGQGKHHRRDRVRAGAERLEHTLLKLAEERERRPIFLASHVPLHFSGRSSPLQGTGDNVYARELFQVINQAGTQLNLVYLYGHNHSRGWDSYLGGSCVFRAPGDQLLVPDPKENATVTSEYTREELSFTYLNAGYVGYFSSAGGEDGLTCTVCEIQPDRLVFTRYAEDGVHLLSALGTPNPAKDDTALISSADYGKERNSPQEVPLWDPESMVRKVA